MSSIFSPSTMISLSHLVARRTLSTVYKHIKVSDKVEQALRLGKGIVALESTVITHGLPYPANHQTGLLLEKVVTEQGAVPATIALIDGKIHIGLTAEELERIALGPETNNVVKVSKRDIANTLVTEKIGGTTVAATMWIAHQVGIKVFATGGIGGVHRGAEETFDISADLQELSQTPVTVVCAGVKSILDVPKTVEYLETHGVNTLVYNDVNSFPGFFVRETNQKGQLNTTSLDIVADIIVTSKELGMKGGTILACPIPKEFAAEGQEVEKSIEQAVNDAKRDKISGQASTPYILARVKELTKGESMKTNIALLENNARIAAQLANLLAHPGSSRARMPVIAPVREISTTPSGHKKPVVVTIGAAIADYEALTNEIIKDDGGSYVGTVQQRCGGVGRNHADALARLGCHSYLITCFGDDRNGEFLREKGKHIDFSRSEVIPGVPSATYMSMNCMGNVRYGVSSIGEIVEHISPELMRLHEDLISEADFIVLDGNVPIDTMKEVFDIVDYYKRQLWYEPTDIAKMKKIFENDGVNKLTACSPNANEFVQFCRGVGLSVPKDALTDANKMAAFLQQHIDKLIHNMECLVVTLAQAGSVVCKKFDGSFHCAVLPPPVYSQEEVVSVSGAGDCFNSGLLAGWLFNLPWDDTLQLAQTSARYTLGTMDAVSPQIHMPTLLERLKN